MPKWLVNRKISTLILITLVGLLVGSFLSSAMGHLPDSVVKTTFTYPISINIGGDTVIPHVDGAVEAVSTNTPHVFDLGFIKFIFGFKIMINLLSFVGIAISLWMYRWFE